MSSLLEFVIKGSNLTSSDEASIQTSYRNYIHIRYYIKFLCFVSLCYMDISLYHIHQLPFAFQLLGCLQSSPYPSPRQNSTIEFRSFEVELSLLSLENESDIGNGGFQYVAILLFHNPQIAASCSGFCACKCIS